MDAETEFFVRIVLLLFKGGTLVCKGILDRELTNVSLHQILQDNEPRLKRKLLKTQYSILFPRNGIPNIQDFDLSLLTVVLLIVLNIPRDERLEVENIKDIRTYVIHGKVSLDQGTFTNMKHRLKEALTNLSAKLDADLQKECAEMTEQFLADPLDEKTAIYYIHGIRNDEEILQRIHEMLEEQMATVDRKIQESENRITAKFDSKMDQQERVLDEIITTLKEYHEDKDKSTSTEEGGTLDPPLCEKCFENNNATEAKYKCHTCDKYLCSECYQSTHVKSLLLSMKNHHIQNAKDSEDAKVNMKNMDVCNTHSRYYKHYCKQHEVLCCDKCVSELHKSCQKVEEISKIAESSANYMLNPVAEIDRLQESTTSMDYWMASFKEKLNKNMENTPVRLQELRKQMIDLFDKKASIVTNKAMDFTEEQLLQIQKNREQCRELIHNTEHTKRSLIRIATTGTSVQRFIANQNLSAQIKTFEDDFSLIRRMYKASPDFADFQIFEEIAQELGPLSLNVPNSDNNF